MSKPGPNQVLSYKGADMCLPQRVNEKKGTQTLDHKKQREPASTIKSNQKQAHDDKAVNMCRLFSLLYFVSSRLLLTT